MAGEGRRDQGADPQAQQRERAAAAQRQPGRSDQSESKNEHRGVGPALGNARGVTGDGRAGKRVPQGNSDEIGESQQVDHGGCESPYRGGVGCRP